MIYFNYYTEHRPWVRLFLWIKRGLGFRMLYGEIAVINGPGPCQRCVGRSVNTLPISPAGHSHADSASLHAHSHAPEVIGGGNRLKEKRGFSEVNPQCGVPGCNIDHK